MHRLIPEFIQVQYENETLKGSFEACALFVDITGFTSITDAIMDQGQHGAEVLANLIRDVFDPLMQSVYGQGGYVTNLAGDAFTALFPSDGDTAGAVKRAIAAAQGIQATMEESSGHDTLYGKFVLSLKVGLAAGEVNWGIIKSKDESRAVYYFQGPAIDGCAQAEKAARPGEVIIDANVYRISNPLLVAEPIEEFFRITSTDGELPAPQSINILPVDSDIVSIFFPDEVTRQTLRGEFRQVVSMFVSLPTVRTVEQLQKFMQLVFELQDRYGGLLNRLDFGDKGANFLIFWGAPRAYENDLMRALNYILELQSHTVIPVNAGITYGIAHGGYSGGALAGEYTCHGRGTSLAARLMEGSPRGDIWVDENVASKAELHFEFDLEGEMSFKGFAEKQRVFVLLERKEEFEPLFDRNLVGRQAEQDMLREFVEPLWLGQYPGTLVISGEPGIGKSRLIHGFLSILEFDSDKEISVFTCQTDEILRESLNPFRYLLRDYFGQSEQQSVARNKRSFNRQIDKLIAKTPDSMLKSELDRTRSFMGALINLSWPDSLYEQLDAQGRYDNSFAALVAFLHAASLECPVVLLIEDIHWLDEDSIVFLQHLSQKLIIADYAPIAILATARSDGNRKLLGDEIDYHELNLGQMPPADLAIMASEQLEGSIGKDLLELLIERSEGNPFFVEQTLRYLQEQGQLRYSAGHWDLKAEKVITLPPDIRAVMVARIDRLTYEIKEVVQTASVLGREFELGLLSKILRDDSSLDEKVARAEHLSIWSALSEIRYLFKHALLRDAAYRMQVRSRRQSLHRLAVEGLEELHQGDLGPHYGELGYHAEQGRQEAKAREYLALAGEAAAEEFQNRQAVDYFSRALKFTQAEDLEARFELLLSREKLYHSLGLRKNQKQDQLSLAEIADEMQDIRKKIVVQIRKAWLYWWTADYPKALEAAKQAASIAEDENELDLAGKANVVRSWVLLQQGRAEEALESAERALSEALDSDNRKLKASAINVLGLISLASGDYYQSRLYLDEFLNSSREIENRKDENTALNNLGVASMPLGDYEMARACFDKALSLSVEQGDDLSVGTATINLSWVAATRGEWASAIKYGEAGLSIKEKSGHIEALAEGLLWIGHGWLGLNQPAKALVSYDESLKLRRELGQEHYAMGVLAGMARAALAQNEIDTAGEYVKEIMSFLEIGSLDGTWEPLRIYLTCYRILELFQDDRASEVLDAANQEIQLRAGKIPDPSVRRMFLENVPWHREIVATYIKSTSEH